MIVDEMRAASEEFRQIFAYAGMQVVRVPFQVCPFTWEPNDEPGLWWQDWTEERKALVPKRKDESIDCSWWRPPFADMAIVSEQNERGALLVLGRDPKKHEGTFEVLTEDNGRLVPDWAAVLCLVVLDARVGPRVISLSAVRVYAIDGNLYTGRSLSREAIETSVMMSRILHDKGSHRWEMSIRDAYEELWRTKRLQAELDVGNMTSVFTTTCALMCCKNVYTEKIEHAVKLQNARERRGKLPLVSYHTLKLRLPSRRHTVASGSGRGESLALHWVRGHFKTYTKERPLLGRATGTWWWTSHLAGQADRVVLKDYEIEEMEKNERRSDES